MAILDGIAEILKPLPSPIRVEGHTDNRPIKTAQFPSNWELSAPAPRASCACSRAVASRRRA